MVQCYETAPRGGFIICGLFCLRECERLPMARLSRQPFVSSCSGFSGGEFAMRKTTVPFGVNNSFGKLLARFPSQPPNPLQQLTYRYR